MPMGAGQGAAGHVGQAVFASKRLRKTGSRLAGSRHREKSSDLVVWIFFPGYEN
jgi:hypothetical protein